MAITLKAENLTESFSPPFKIPMWIISLHLSLTTQSCIEYRGVYNGVKVEQAPGKPPQFTGGTFENSHHRPKDGPAARSFPEEASSWHSEKPGFKNK